MTKKSYKLFSWNVNGLRAVINKEAFLPFVAANQPDLLCLQEIKARPDQVLLDLPEYQEAWNPAARPGYSGTAIFSKTSPKSLSSDFGAFNIPPDGYGDLMSEGRIQTAEFPEFYLVNVYVPNSKADLSRLSLREQFWDPTLLKYLKSLETKKPVVICGDFNAAHTEIDLARPKTNHKNAGFTDQERQGITNLLAANFIDTFRHLNPKSQRYTWWSHRSNARANNVGWRIDYFFISKSLLPQLKSAEIYEQITGSDHCPISIELEF